MVIENRCHTSTLTPPSVCAFICCSVAVAVGCCVVVELDSSASAGVVDDVAFRGGIASPLFQECYALREIGIISA